MEQKHLENLRLEKKQETILVRITEKVWETDILKDDTANEWIFQYVFIWQKRNKVKNNYKVKNLIIRE